MIIYMAKTDDSDFIYKYVVIGEAGVGKTSLVRQFIHNEYNDYYNTTYLYIKSESSVFAI